MKYRLGVTCQSLVIPSHVRLLIPIGLQSDHTADFSGDEAFFCSHYPNIYCPL